MAEGSAKGHRFKSVTLTVPSVCTACHGFIYGIYQQGERCCQCEQLVHNSCQRIVKTNCCKMFPPTTNLHMFDSCNLFTPSYCDHCGGFIWGFRSQACRCRHGDCGLVVHHRCVPFVGGPCGGNPHCGNSLMAILAPSATIVMLAAAIIGTAAFVRGRLNAN